MQRLSCAGSRQADSMENGEELQRRATARQACPSSSEVLLPCSVPICSPALPGKASASHSNRWKLPPKESGHDKGKQELRFSCQRPGNLSLSPLDPESRPQSLPTSSQESKLQASLPDSGVHVPASSFRPRSPGPQLFVSEDLGNGLDTSHRSQRNPGCNFSAFPRASEMGNWLLLLLPVPCSSKSSVTSHLDLITSCPQGTSLYLCLSCLGISRPQPLA